MKDTPTPMTDEACNRTYAEGVSHIPLVGFMEQLERELAEAVNRLNDTLVAMEMLGSKHERELAKMEDIIARALKSLPVGYLPSHTPESLPSRIDHLVKELAEMDEQCQSWADQARSWKLKADVLSRQLEELKEWQTLATWGGTPQHVHKFIKGQQARIHAAQDAEEQLESWQKLALSSEVLQKRAVTECVEAMEQRDRLAKALEACREDSCELLSERSWWADEPRCGYSGRYNETAENIKRADDALAAVKGGADE